MKKKLLALNVAVILLCIAFAACLSGCDGFGMLWKNVSTYEELIARYFWNDDGGYSVKLTADIDCEFATITPLLLGKTFDGQGHTIKNAVVKAEYGYASFFHEITQTIKNVTFENITVQGAGQCDAIVAAAGCKEISNVHVKNSKLTATQTIRDARYACFIGGIFGGTRDGWEDDSLIDCVITDCTVENTEIVLNECKSDKINQAEIFIGGIAGGCSKISGCRVENCNISAVSSDMWCTPFVGGVVGTVSGGVENTGSVNNVLTATALYYKKEMFSMYSTSTAYCGGIAARVLPVKNEKIYGINCCFAEDNEITAQSTGSVYAGGLLGYITKLGVNQCYAKSNSIIMDNFISGNKDDDIQRRCGGLIGSAVNNSVTSCFVYNDKGLFEYTFPTFKNGSKAAGLVAGIGNITVSKCATFNAEEQINSSTTDEFCPAEIENLTNCYVSSIQFGNACGCETLDEDFWNSPNSLKSKLALTNGYWKFDNGIPYFDFSM